MAQPDWGLRRFAREQGENDDRQCAEAVEPSPAARVETTGQGGDDCGGGDRQHGADRQAHLHQCAAFAAMPRFPRFGDESRARSPGAAHAEAAEKAQRDE
jgi:hypothetical protein